MNIRFLRCSLVLALGCASAPPVPPPLTYLASERPQGAIIPKRVDPFDTRFSRGGLYFLNFGFRPAADVGSYLKNVEKGVGSPILTGVDVKLVTPFAFDILLFGFNTSEDHVASASASKTSTTGR